MELLEMREEQLKIHMCSVDAGSSEERKIRALLAAIGMRKKMFQEFIVSRDAKENTIH